MQNYPNVSEVTMELTPEEISRLDAISQAAGREGREYEVLSAVSTYLGTRESQQDSLYADVVQGRNAIGIVCDGMGGLQGGETASQTALTMFVEDYELVRYTENNFCDFFREEMVEIDRTIAGLTNEEGDYLNAGTTLVAASISEGFLQWVSVGDSKIYIIRGDDIVCVTNEHNYQLLLDDRLKNQEISEEEYHREMKRGQALISYLGMGNVSLMDLNPKPLKLENKDIVLLCSDGLYKALQQDQILQIILEYGDQPDKTLAVLQEEAYLASSNGQDNTSIVMLLYQELN